MKTVKRLELVIDSLHAESVLDALRAEGVDGYTVIRNASGWGDRGERTPDGISGVFENCVILCAVSPEKIDAITARLRPLFRRHGGVGLLSDAQWMLH